MSGHDYEPSGCSLCSWWEPHNPDSDENLLGIEDGARFDFMVGLYRGPTDAHALRVERSRRDRERFERMLRERGL